MLINCNHQLIICFILASIVTVNTLQGDNLLIQILPTPSTTTRRPTFPPSPPTTRTTVRPSHLTTRPPNCPPCNCTSAAASGTQRTNRILVGVVFVLGLGVVTLLGVQMYSKYNINSNLKPPPRYGQSEENFDYRVRRRPLPPPVQRVRMVQRPPVDAYMAPALQPSTRRSSSSFNTLFMDPGSNNPSAFESSEMPQGQEVPIRKQTPRISPPKIIPGSPGVTGMVIGTLPPQPMPPPDRRNQNQ